MAAEATAMPLDVVIVTWNSRAMVLRCLERIDPSSVERVVVVDNASGDGTAEAVKHEHPEADLLRLDIEVGLASAYNRGAELGSAGLVLFLNDDILCVPTSVRTLVAALQERPAAVAAAGRLVDPRDGSTQAEYLPRPFPTLTSFASMLAGRARPPVLRPDEGEIVPVEQPPGACLLVRREVLDAVGGWDEDFAFWYEDVDLSRRLHGHGDVLYVSTAAFEHVGGQSAARLSQAQIVSRHYRGALLYTGKHFQMRSRVGAGILFAAAAATRLPFASDHALRRAYAGVLRDGLRTAAGRPPLAR
jgi:GT2 family glycosyltransferase